MFKQSIKDKQEFSHTGGQRDFPELAGSAEMLVKGSYHGIAARCREGSHVQRATQLGFASPDAALTTMVPAIVIQRCHARQRGGLMTVRPSQFRELCNNSSRHDRADSRNALQQLSLSLPDRIIADFRRDILVDLAQLPFQPGDVGLDLHLDSSCLACC